MARKRARQPSTSSKSNLSKEPAAALGPADQAAEHLVEREEAAAEPMGQPRKGIFSRISNLLPLSKKRKTSHREPLPVGASASSSASSSSSAQSEAAVAANGDNFTRSESAALLALVRNPNTPFRQAVNSPRPSNVADFAESSRSSEQSAAGPTVARRITGKAKEEDVMVEDEPAPTQAGVEASASADEAAAFADEILAAAATPHRRRQRSRIVLLGTPASASASQKVEDSEPEEEKGGDGPYAADASTSFDSLSHPASELAMGTPTKRLRSGNLALAPDDSTHIYYSDPSAAVLMTESSSARRRARSRSAGPSKSRRRNSSVDQHDHSMLEQSEAAEKVMAANGGKEDEKEGGHTAAALPLEESAEAESVPEPASPPVTRALAKKLAEEEAQEQEAGIRRSARLAGEEVEITTLSDAERAAEEEADEKESEDEDRMSRKAAARKRLESHEASDEGESSTEDTAFASQPQMASNSMALELDLPNSQPLPGNTRPKRVYGQGRKLGVGTADARARASIRTRRSQLAAEFTDEQLPGSSQSPGKVKHEDEAVNDGPEARSQVSESEAASAKEEEADDRAEVSALAISPTKPRGLTSDTGSTASTPRLSKSQKQKAKRRERKRRKEEQQEQHEDEEVEEAEEDVEEQNKDRTAELRDGRRSRDGQAVEDDNGDAERLHRPRPSEAEGGTALRSTSVAREGTPQSELSMAAKSSTKKTPRRGKGKQSAKGKGKDKGKARQTSNGEEDAESDAEMADVEREATQEAADALSTFNEEAHGDGTTGKQNATSPKREAAPAAAEFLGGTERKTSRSREVVVELPHSPSASRLNLLQRVESPPARPSAKLQEVSPARHSAKQSDRKAELPAEEPARRREGHPAATSPALPTLPTVPDLGPDSLLPPGSTSARKAEADAFRAEAANGGGIPAGLDNLPEPELVSIPTVAKAADREAVSVPLTEEEVTAAPAQLGNDILDGSEERLRLEDGAVLPSSQPEPSTVPDLPQASQESVGLQAPLASQSDSLRDSTPPTSFEAYRQQQKESVAAAAGRTPAKAAGTADTDAEEAPVASSTISSSSEEDELGAHASAIQKRKRRAERKRNQEAEDERLSVLMEAARDDGPSGALPSAEPSVTDAANAAAAAEEAILSAVGGADKSAAASEPQERHQPTQADVASIMDVVEDEKPREAPAPNGEATPAGAAVALTEEEEEQRQTDTMMEDLFDFPSAGAPVTEPAAQVDASPQVAGLEVPIFEMDQIPAAPLTLGSMSNIPAVTLDFEVPGLDIQSMEPVPPPTPPLPVSQDKGKARAEEPSLGGPSEALQVFDDSTAGDDLGFDEPSVQRPDGSTLTSGLEQIAAHQPGSTEVLNGSLYPSLSTDIGRPAAHSPLGDEEKENQTGRNPYARQLVAASKEEGPEVIDMTAASSTSSDAGANGSAQAQYADARTGNEYATGSRSARLTTPPGSSQPGGKPTREPLTPRSHASIPVAPTFSPAPQSPALRVPSVIGATPASVALRNQPSFVFGPLTSSVTAHQDAQREAEERARINRGEFLPLRKKEARRSGPPPSITRSRLLPERFAENSSFAGFDGERAGAEAGAVSDPNALGFERLQVDNSIFTPPSTAPGLQPWSHLAAAPPSSVGSYSSSLYGRSPAPSPSPSPSPYQGDYAARPAANRGTANGGGFVKRRAGRSTFGGPDASRSSAGRRSVDVTMSRKSGAMIGRVSGVGALLPMGWDEHQAKVKHKRQQALERFMNKHYEICRRENAKLKKDEFMGLLKKGTRQLKDEARHASDGKDVKPDEHYMEQFIQLLRERAARAQAQRMPPAQHRLEHYDRIRREQRRKLITMRGILGRQPLPEKLTREQNAYLEEALKKRGKIREIPGASVTDRDMAMLGPGTWLNDESINMYGTMILHRSEKAEKERARQVQQGLIWDQIRKNPEERKWHGYWKVHLFTSLFYGKLERDGFKGVARWTSRKKINIFTKDIVLIPVNCDNYHWTCGAINFRKKRLEYYDSMVSGKPGEFFNRMRAYLSAEHEAVFKEPMDLSGWTELASRESPKQANGHDCGVFASQTLEQISRRDPFSPYPSKPAYVPPSQQTGSGAPPAGAHTNEDEDAEEGDEEEDDDLADELWNFSQDDMTYLRRRMQYELARGELLEA
ncbi:hypothetical protein OC834_004947 [Tilletia horrida]|nr:hypothetical protein OC834_004947 [Tilletia horrida]